MIGATVYLCPFYVTPPIHGRLLDGAIYPLDLAVGPRVVRLLKPMLDVVGLADHVEAHLTRLGGVPVTRLVGELDAIISQDRMDAVRYSFQQVFEELPGRSWIRFVDQLCDRELACAVDADEQVELAFGSLHLGGIYVEKPIG